MKLKELIEKNESLEMELAYLEYELLQYRHLADKHDCKSAKELDDFIDRAVWSQTL